jgi:hypothetical protein
MVRDYSTSERPGTRNQGGGSINSPRRRMLRDQAILDRIERRDMIREEDEVGVYRTTDPALIR